jgi:hypothetical protein
MKQRVRMASLAALILALSLAHGATQAQSANGATGQGTERQQRLLARLPMAEAAKVAGEHYVRPFDLLIWMTARNFDDLGKSSELVVVGKVISGESALSDDGMYIKTRSSFQVIEVIKGSPLMTGSILKVVTPGGTIAFADGTSAETTTAEAQRLNVGRSYALFLAQTRQPPGVAAPKERVYLPVLAGQGIFELRKEGVRSGGRDTDGVTQEHDKTSVEAFLVKLRKLKLAGSR